MMYFSHVDKIFCPFGHNIQNEIFVHVDEKYYHIIGEKMIESGRKFSIFWTMELMKQTKRCSLKRHCEIVGTYNNS